MYIYRKSTDSFGALALIPQDYFKFWNGDVDTTGIGTYTKPLDTLPEVTWEIDLSADEWRERIAGADAENPIPISRLREIPDSYIEAVFLNVLYGYNMTYVSNRATYLPPRMGYTFNQDPINYPALAMAMLGIKTLIQEEVNKGTPVGTENAGILRNLLRHITYVAIVILRNNNPLQPTGNVLVSALTSLANGSRETLYYDTNAMAAFIAKGGTEALVAANWVFNQSSPNDDTISNSADLLARWKELTDITAA